MWRTQMSKSYNKTIIIGRLNSNPIEKNGKAIFALLNTVWNSAARKEQIQMHQIYAVGKQAELVMKYLCKGDLCCIEGKLDERLSICAEHITFLSSKKRGEATSQEGNDEQAN